MGRVYTSSGSNSLIEGLTQDIKNIKNTTEHLNSAIDTLTATVGTFGMQGKAYETGSNLFNNEIRQVVTDINTLCDDIEVDLTLYKTANDNVAKYDYLNEDILKSLIEQFKLRIRLLYVGKALGLKVVDQLDSAKTSKQKYEDQLNALVDFDNATSGLFETSTKTLKTLLSFNSALSNSFISNDGQVKLAREFRTNLKSLTSINPYQKLANHTAKQIARRDGLSAKQQTELVDQLAKNITELRIDGWSLLAIQDGYTKHIKLDNNHELKTQLASLYNQARTFGSSAFKRMWQIDSHYSSGTSGRYRSQNLLRIAMKYVGMPNELIIDDRHPEHLLLYKKISHSLSPADSFWDSFAKVVQKAFPGNDFTDKTNYANLKKQIHQFRYVISEHQAQWVRNKYPGMSDQKALAQYLATLKEGKGNGEYYLGESSRLHNKGRYNEELEIMEYPDNSKVNFKIVVGFHSEFILDSQGNFLNEIDPYWVNKGTKTNGIVNGASFNYANANNSLHEKLDSDSPKLYDPSYRRNWSRGYYSPELHKNSHDHTDGNSYCYENKNGIYANNGKSKKQQVLQRVNEFRTLIRKYG